MSWFKDLINNTVSTVKTATNNIVSTAQAAGQSVVSAVKDAKESVGDAAEVVKLAPLLPFKATMTKALKRKGIPYNDNIKDIAVKFRDYIIKKKSNFDEADYKYSLVTSFDYIGLAGEVLAFIKNLLGKSEKGTATSEEMQIVSDAKSDAANVPTGESGIPKNFNPNASETMNKGNWMKWGAIALIVAVVVYFIVKKK